MIHPGARYLESENRSEREGCVVDTVVIHHISLPPGEFGGDDVAAFFQNRLDHGAHPFYREIEGVRVSAHFFIDRAGALTQFVDTELAAWHAGVSRWKGRDGVNRFSVGIELEGDEASGYTEAQYETLEALLAWLRAAHPAICAENVVGHEEVAPGRKCDPGPLFDWERVRRGRGFFPVG